MISDKVCAVFTIKKGIPLGIQFLCDKARSAFHMGAGNSHYKGKNKYFYKAENGRWYSRTLENLTCPECIKKYKMFIALK